MNGHPFEETAAALGITTAQAIQLEALAMKAWADAYGDNRTRARAALTMERAAGRVDSPTYCAAMDRL